MAINTLIFGATGNVASHAAKYASTHEANITFAMRDPSKQIPTLPTTDSKHIIRVKADLTDPSSVKAAATSSPTPFTSAFIYLVHEGPNGTPRESIQALKDAGVKHVIFLSSYSVRDPIRDIEPDLLIPYVHAQVEIMLDEIFGEGKYTALRPAFFATNVLRYVPEMKGGVVKEIYPENPADYVAPRDIGEVAGYFLLREEDDLPRSVDICGQQVVAQREAIKMCARAGGQEVEVEHVDEETGVERMVSSGLPEPFARYLAKMQRLGHEGVQREFAGPRFEKGQRTVKRILGREGITLKQWIEENKQVFA